ncbi:hypothetical protein D3C73_1459850 [compost metagenome]
MKALIPVRLGVLNIILFFQDSKVRLFLQHIPNRIDIRQKGARDPQTGDILDMFPNAFERNFAFLAVQLI